MARKSWGQTNCAQESRKDGGTRPGRYQYLTRNILRAKCTTGEKNIKDLGFILTSPVEILFLRQLTVDEV